jgi:hypothetical protein
LTAEKALEHPWIRVKGPLIKKRSKLCHAETSVKIVNRMKSFKNSKKLKKAVVTYIASRASNDHVKDMQKAFLRIDIDKDGVLSF